jgi:hypothetical protein
MVEECQTIEELLSLGKTSRQKEGIDGIDQYCVSLAAN